MKVALALCEAGCASWGAGDIAQWATDVVAQGYTFKQHNIPSAMTVKDAASIVSAECPADTGSHVQLFGAVPVPRNYCNPDGHGFRYSDCDARYGTDEEAAWNPTALGYANYWYPVGGAKRSVSRIDLSQLPVDEAAAFHAVMQRNHAYRTGAYEYQGVACLVNRLEYKFPGIGAASISHMEAHVGYGNVKEIYCDNDRFFQDNAGQNYLEGSLLTGGDDFRFDGYMGHLIGIAFTKDFCLGAVPIGLLRFYCSHGWEFEWWPVARAAMAGGSLACVYDVAGWLSLNMWGTETTLGEAMRIEKQYQGSDWLWTMQGDGTLLRRVQDMGISQAVFDSYRASVDARLVKLEGAPVVVAPPVAVVVVTLAKYQQVANPAIFRDVTGSVQTLYDIGKPWHVHPDLPDPYPGILKQLSVSWTRDGAPRSQVFGQFDLVQL